MKTEISNIDYVYILEYFGIDNQIRKTEEEFQELMEAIRSGDPAKIKDELGDLLNMIIQLIIHYSSEEDKSEVLDLATGKVFRTLERIKNGYYNKKLL